MSVSSSASPASFGLTLSLPQPLASHVQKRIEENKGDDDDDDNAGPSKLTVHLLFFTQSLASFLTPVFAGLVVSSGIVYSTTQDLQSELNRNASQVCDEVYPSVITLLILLLVALTFGMLFLGSNYLQSYVLFLRSFAGVLFYLALLALAVYNVIATVYLGKQKGLACRNLEDEGNMAWNMVLAVVVCVWISLFTPIFTILTYWWINRMNQLIDDYTPKLTPSLEDGLIVPPHRAFRYN